MRYGRTGYGVNAARHRSHDGSVAEKEVKDEGGSQNTLCDGKMDAITSHRAFLGAVKSLVEGGVSVQHSNRCKKQGG